nr:MAG TPA: Kti11, Kti13 transfer, tRNA modification, Complex [Caudoviricetes sp.]
MFLHVFVTFLLFLCIFMRLCVCALRVALWHALAPCMVHGIGMHVMHHIIMCSSSCSSCSSLIIIDHHHVHRSLFVDQSLNDDH